MNLKRKNEKVWPGNPFLIYWLGKKAVFCLVVLFVAAYIWGAISVTSKGVAGSDFVNGYVSAMIVRDGQGEKIYDSELNYAYQDKILKDTKWKNLNVFRPLPFTSFIYGFFTYFPVKPAYTLFFLVNLALILGIWGLFIRNFKRTKRYKFFILLLILVYLPIFKVLVLGQISLFLLLVALLVYLNIKKEKFFWAGILSSLMLIKTQYGIFVPFPFILSKDKRSFASGFLLGLVLFLSLSVWISGPKPLLGYPSFLMDTETKEYGSWVDSISTFYFGLKSFWLISVPKRVLFALNMVFYFAYLSLFYWRRFNSNLDKVFVSAVSATILFSIHSYSYDWVLLLLPVILILETAIGPKGLMADGFLALALIFYIFPVLREDFPSSLWFLVFAAGAVYPLFSETGFLKNLDQKKKLAV